MGMIAHQAEGTFLDSFFPHAAAFMASFGPFRLRFGVRVRVRVRVRGWVASSPVP